jgi:hypothetical protein
MAGVGVSGTPFNALGSAHKKVYTTTKLFHAKHYTFFNIVYASNKVVSIKISNDDLLPLQQISLLRAGDRNIDNDVLEINTYNKLNNKLYKWVLDNIIQHFFVNKSVDGYNKIKDPSWPTITNNQEFDQLPEHIKKECIEQHNLEIFELSETHPDCPRHILREFFKIGFQHPDQSGFMVEQNKANYTGLDVHFFPFGCFYNTDQFLLELKKVAEWANLLYTCEDEITKAHKEFLARQPYKDSKQKCDRILMQIKSNDTDIPRVDLLEEAYINAMLGEDYFK